MALLSPSPDKINLNIKIEINNFPIHASYNNIFTHLSTRFCNKLLFKETFSTKEKYKYCRSTFFLFQDHV